MRIKMHLLGTGIAVLFSVYAVTAYADQEVREHRRSAGVLMPEIRYDETDKSQGYYKTAPEIRIIHKQAGAVTKYEFLAADNTKQEGSLELMEGQPEESVYLAGDLFKDGENILRVWMEMTEPDENGSEEGKPEGSETGGKDSEETGAGENGTEENGAGGNGTEENGAGENETERNHPEKQGTGENHSGENETAENVSVEEHGRNQGMEDSEDPDAGNRPEVPDTSVKDDNPAPAPSGEPEIVFEKEFRFLVDTTRPQKPRFSYNQAVRDGVILSNGPVELTVKSADTGSGIEAIYYKAGDGITGVLKGESGSIVLNPGFHGKVEAYAADKAGNHSETEVSERILCEDRPPELWVEAGDGTDTWHSEPVRVNVKASDDLLSSGLRWLKCYAGGELLVHKENDFNTGVDTMEAGFTVELSSEGGNGIPVIVETEDWAGNYRSESRTVYIDKIAPSIRSEGIHDQMITGTPVTGKILIREENDLALGRMEVWKVASDQKRELLEEKEKTPEPFTGAQDIEWEVPLKEDGTYQILVTAKDRAGHEIRQDSQVILDQANPVIRYVDQMQGVYVPYFQWNYGKEEVVSDDTEYSYEIALDGVFYTAGRKITKEGARMLQVRAVDAAGNESTAEAVFQIDHTPPRIRVTDVEDGDSYEDMAAVSISVDGKGEYLKEILVNAEKMKLEADCQIFTRSFQEPGDYQIQVLAEDLAGNQEKEQITFRIEEQKKLAGGVLKPITRIFRNVDRPAVGNTQGQEAEQEKSPAVFWLAGCLVLAVSVYLFRRNTANRGGSHG